MVFSLLACEVKSGVCLQLDGCRFCRGDLIGVAILVDHSFISLNCLECSQIGNFSSIIAFCVLIQDDSADDSWVGLLENDIALGRLLYRISYYTNQFNVNGVLTLKPELGSHTVVKYFEFAQIITRWTLNSMPLQMIRKSEKTPDRNILRLPSTDSGERAETAMSGRKELNGC